MFSTGMSGYQETLTDPSYHRQIVVATAPQIGNTGWNTEDSESRGDRIWVAGYAVRDPSPRVSNWRATTTLEDELVRQRIVGVAGIDTRAVVRHIRNFGSMKAGIFSGAALAEPDELIERVRAQPRCSAPTWPARSAPPIPMSSNPRAASVYRRRTRSRHQNQHAAELRPARHPQPCAAVVGDLRADRRDQAARRVLVQRPRRSGHGRPRRRRHPAGAGRRNPLFGICFGNQILGRALGLSTYKMVFGHRGINVPVIDHATGRIAITAQNHGFAVQGEAGQRFDTPFGPAIVSHTCANDGVVEGVKLASGRAFSVQYHPEAAAGPHDAEYLFDQFVDLMAGEGH
ncbi:peptidase C26 family protein [Mycobacterium xenopi 3993]|nr:peptidase C26 family protein [Mycobacterium xenopi 3993]